jgi:hypothetical protein
MGEAEAGRAAQLLRPAAGHVTFGNDAAGVVNCDHRRRAFWASDYPHPEARGRTRRRRWSGFATVEPAERRRITYETTARLYGLEAPVGAST